MSGRIAITVGRIEKEKNVIGKMVGVYCRAHHKPETGLCTDCSNILEYSLLKLDICPFDEEKPSCKKCEVHCYDPAERERIREIMRYSGPRMLFIDIKSWIEHNIKKR